MAGVACPQCKVRLTPPDAPETAEPAAKNNKKTLLIGGGIGAVVLVAVIAIAVGSGGGNGSSDNNGTEPDPGKSSINGHSSNNNGTKPKPDAVSERIQQLKAQENDADADFRSLVRDWETLLKDAQGDAKASSIQSELERVRQVATHRLETATRDTFKQLNQWLDEKEYQRAGEKLKSWKDPVRWDLDGSFQKKRDALLSEANLLLELKSKIEPFRKQLRAGGDDATPESLLSPYFSSDSKRVKKDAKAALGQLTEAYSIGAIRRRLKERSRSAQSRLQEVQKSLESEKKNEERRLAAWEQRVIRASKENPFTYRDLGISRKGKLHVSSFDGTQVKLSGGGIELSFVMEQLDKDVCGRILNMAIDPSIKNDVMDAAEMAVRLEAWDWAERFYDRLVSIDDSLATRVPDVRQLKKGVGTLHAESRLKGNYLNLAYPFDDPAELKDFRFDEGSSGEIKEGRLRISGKVMFLAELREMKFSARASLDVGLGTSGKNSTYIIGAAIERTPGVQSHLVAITKPNSFIQISYLSAGGRRTQLAEERIGGISRLTFHLQSPNLEIAVDGKTLWKGNVGEFWDWVPVAGGIALDGQAAHVEFRDIQMSGVCAPSWLRKLNADRRAKIEEALQRVRIPASADGDRNRGSSRRFGSSPLTPIPLEGLIKDVTPEQALRELEAARRLITEPLERPTRKEFEARKEAVSKSLDHAVNAAPWLPHIRFYRAEWRFLFEAEMSAREELRALFRDYPEFSEAGTALADLLLMSREPDQARTILQKVLATRPDSAGARLTLAYLEYLVGNSKTALKECRLASRLRPTDSAFQRRSRRLAHLIQGPMWPEFVEVEGKNYTLRAEIPQSGSSAAAKEIRRKADEYLTILETARTWFAELVPGEPRKESKPKVYFFGSSEGYHVYADFTQDDRLEHSVGVFLIPFRQLLFFEAESRPETLDTMIHEAFHEYLDRRIPNAPIWLNEGMAEYASGIIIDEGRILSKGLLMRDRLSYLLAALNGGWKGVPFELIMQESQQEFYSIHTGLQYAQAWSMIHFFHHHESGKYSGVLKAYMKLLSEGKDGKAAFDASFGKQDLEKTRKEWILYVKKLR